MIQYKKGNAITLAMKSKNVAFAHGCNCFCAMKRGVAKEVKGRLFLLYVADVATEVGDRSKIGKITFSDFSWGRGYNMYTQYTRKDPDDMVDWTGVTECFVRVFNDMRTRGLKELIIPKITTGVAVGHLTEEESWARVVKNIEQNCPEGITVTVVEFDPNA